MIAITGATGHLGRLVVEDLLKTTAPGEVVAAVRTPGKAEDLAAKGVAVREADYSRPETLERAFAGVEKLLLISSSEIGNRVAQHKAVIDAAQKAGVKLIAYTGLLHAERGGLKLAQDHLATEEYLKESGVPYVFLRNGWYFENQTATLGMALKHGAIAGASGNGKFAAASRADYAAAAAKVLSTEGHENAVYELAGDSGYTRAELAEEVSRQSGKTITYQNMPEEEYAALLTNFLPAAAAEVIADAEAKAADGALDDTSHTLSRLIGRPTTTLADAVREALQ